MRPVHVDRREQTARSNGEARPYFGNVGALLARMASPALRLHRYRNVRELALKEALCRRYCSDRG